MIWLTQVSLLRANPHRGEVSCCSSGWGRGTAGLCWGPGAAEVISFPTRGVWELFLPGAVWDIRAGSLLLLFSGDISPVRSYVLSGSSQHSLAPLQELCVSWVQHLAGDLQARMLSAACALPVEAADVLPASWRGLLSVTCISGADLAVCFVCSVLSTSIPLYRLHSEC